MTDTDSEKRMRVAQHLRVLVQSMVTTGVDLQALTAPFLNALIQFIASVRAELPELDAENEHPRRVAR
jgi:hypothetical protein